MDATSKLGRSGAFRARAKPNDTQQMIHGLISSMVACSGALPIRGF
jgi:hypothetical protein